MSSIHSAARLGLRRGRKRPVRGGGRPASRIVAVFAVAVMIGGATAAQAAASTGPFTGPSVIVSGNDTDIAVQGPNESLVLYSAVDGTSTWTPEMVAGPGTTYSAPSMILNGSIDIAVQGPNDSLTFYWAFNGSSTWHAETVAAPGTTYSAPSMI